MHFLNPSLFAVLLTLVGIPLFIHWLSRRYPKKFLFSSVEEIRRTLVGRSCLFRWRHRLMLLLRTLADVGCESCHGPASEHVALHLHGKPTGFKFRPLGPEDCKSCHYGEFSRPFKWEKFWPDIQHGKEADMAADR